MLKISDLTVSKSLESREMSSVRGGLDPFAHIDFSSDMTNKLADVTQGFGLALAQGNEGAVTNNQAIAGGNGIDFVPVDQAQGQFNEMLVAGLGNIAVS